MASDVSSATTRAPEREWALPDEARRWLEAATTHEREPRPARMGRLAGLIRNGRLPEDVGVVIHAEGRLEGGLAVAAAIVWANVPASIGVRRLEPAAGDDVPATPPGRAIVSEALGDAHEGPDSGSAIPPEESAAPTDDRGAEGTASLGDVTTSWELIGPKEAADMLARDPRNRRLVVELRAFDRVRLERVRRQEDRRGRPGRAGARSRPARP